MPFYPSYRGSRPDLGCHLPAQMGRGPQLAKAGLDWKSKMTITLPLTLPKGIQAYFDADRNGGPDAVAAAFTENGIVKDKGKTHMGREAIRKWMAEATQQYSYTVEPIFIATENGKTQVTGHAVGDFPGSPVELRFFFVLADDKIAELEITI